MRHRGMAAAPAYVDVYDVRRCQQRTGFRRQHAGRCIRRDVDGEGGVWCRVVQQTVFNHEPRAVEALLAGLEHEHHASGEPIALRAQEFRGRREHRGVCVVTAGVHCAIHRRAKVDVGVFRHRQCIHVAAQQNRSTGARALEYCDEPGRRWTGFEFERQTSECGFDFGKRLRGFQAEFGLAMDRATQCDGFCAQRLRNLKPVGDTSGLIHGALLVGRAMLARRQWGVGFPTLSASFCSRVTTLPILLAPEEARILGSLMEKSVVTPEQYPLTLNALVLACNQKSSRDPVMALDQGSVQHTARQLENKHLVSSEENFRGRVVKYTQRLCNTPFGEFQLSEPNMRWSACCCCGVGRRRGNCVRAAAGFMNSKAMMRLTRRSKG